MIVLANLTFSLRPLLSVCQYERETRKQEYLDTPPPHAKLPLCPLPRGLRRPIEHCGRPTSRGREKSPRGLSLSLLVRPVTPKAGRPHRIQKQHLRANHLMSGRQRRRQHRRRLRCPPDVMTSSADFLFPSTINFSLHLQYFSTVSLDIPTKQGK